MDDLRRHLRTKRISHEIEPIQRSFWLPSHHVTANKLFLDHMEQESFSIPRIGQRHRIPERYQRWLREIGGNQNARHHRSFPGEITPLASGRWAHAVSAALPRSLP